MTDDCARSVPKFALQKPASGHRLSHSLILCQSTGKRSALGTIREAELYGGVLSSSLSREHLALTAEFLRGDECVVLFSREISSLTMKMTNPGPILSMSSLLSSHRPSSLATNLMNTSSQPYIRNPVLPPSRLRFMPSSSPTLSPSAAASVTHSTRTHTPPGTSQQKTSVTYTPTQSATHAASQSSARV